MKAILRWPLNALVSMMIVLLSSAFSPVPSLAASYSPQPAVSDRAAAPYGISMGVHHRACVSAAYTVQRGDTLFGIARRFGIRPRMLAVFNGLHRRTELFAGMRLAIPCVRGNGSGYQPAPSQGYRSGQSTSPGYAPVQPSPTPSPATGQATVVMQNIAFNPANITIHVGQQVVWVNNDSAPHTTTSGSCTGNTCTPSPGWDSGTLNPGQSFSHTFDTAGTFPYFCRIHGAAMQGTVTVMP
jgi:plastocyanin